MANIEPVVRLSKNRLAIVYPGGKGVKVVQIQDDNSPAELFALSPEQVQKIADAEWLPDDVSFDEGLAIVLSWMENR